MNRINRYWDEFCRKAKLEGVQYREAFQFGEKADWLAQLVIEGKKTATSSSYELYQIENEPIPTAGEFSIVLNGADMPVAIIEVESVEMHPLNEVPEAFALAEGAGTYQEWLDAHMNFFSGLFKEYNLEFKEDLPVVCERFRKVYPE